MWKLLIINTALSLYSFAYGFSPDIKANNQDAAIIIHPDEQLSITISMDAQGDVLECDWWLIVSTPLASPDNWYSFDGSILRNLFIVFADVDNPCSIPVNPSGRYFLAIRRLHNFGIP